MIYLNLDILFILILLNYFNMIKTKYINSLGMGDWGLGPIPNPQSPIPNPQSP